MTNKEYVLKYLEERKDKLVDMIDLYSCSFCGDIGLREYCQSNSDDKITCRETIESWLNMERTEPLLFPIGTPVEVHEDCGIRMGYYNGHEHDKHYVIHYKHQLGLRYKDGELYGAKYNANQLQKVGE